MLSEDILQIYASSFRENWESPALTEYTTDETLTYADLARRIARTHIFFELSGVRPGDKVGLLGKNSVSWPTRTDFLQIFTRYLVKPRSETSL